MHFLDFPSFLSTFPWLINFSCVDWITKKKMEEAPKTTTTATTAGHEGKEDEAQRQLVLAVEAHKGYILRLSGKREGFEHWVTEHLKMSGLYWGLCALDMLDALPTDDDDDKEEAAEAKQEGEEESSKGPKRKELVAWVLACQRENGGFGGSIGHDAHLLYTLSAIQVCHHPHQLSLV
jgi:geranylgeranyl transferase type-2 subunit beta